MPASEELVEWLREQIAEQRRTVELAGPGVVGWGTYRHEDGSMKYTSPVSGGDGVWVTAGTVTAPDSVRVVFDPANVLAQCEASEAILNEHVHERPHATAPQEIGCRVCHVSEIDGDITTAPDGWCRTVRAVGIAFRHNAGFRPEWKLD
jgi:hypothetical protein